MSISVCDNSSDPGIRLAQKENLVSGHKNRMWWISIGVKETSPHHLLHWSFAVCGSHIGSRKVITCIARSIIDARVIYHHSDFCHVWYLCMPSIKPQRYTAAVLCHLLAAIVTFSRARAAITLIQIQGSTTNVMIHECLEANHYLTWYSYEVTSRATCFKECTHTHTHIHTRELPSKHATLITSKPAHTHTHTHEA